MNRTSEGLAADLAIGAVAGSLATVVQGWVSSFLYAREDEAARLREDQARGDRSAYEIAVDRATGALGLHPSPDQIAGLGTTIHYGIGIGAGAVYGATRRLIPGSGPIKGLGMGLALWAIADEGMVPTLGLTPGPAAFPWQTHARGLLAHLAFGVAVEGILAASDRLGEVVR